MTRPPPVVRLAILLAAIGCLVAVICCHGDRAKPQPPVSQQAAPAQPPPQQQQAPKPAPNPAYFGATKAPARIY